ncbi:MAG TPA: uracil phosphoribosyltransferase [Micromonospora sp.]
MEIDDPDHLYPRILHASSPNGEIRRRATELGALLARHTLHFVRDRSGPRPRVLAVVILRGGALLYPGFISVFEDSDFCLVGMCRDERLGAVRADYMTPIPQGDYDAVIYLDAVCATGGTLLETRRLVRKECDGGYEVVTVISSSAAATRLLREAGMAVVGLSLQESLQDGLVLPDLGELDAGDLFSGVGFPGREREPGR